MKKQVHKLGSSPIGKYHLTIKRNEPLTYLMTWINLKILYGDKEASFKSFYLYKSLEKDNLIYSDRKYVWLQRVGGGGGELRDEKEHKRTFWVTNVLYFGCGDGHMDANIVCLKWCFLLYVNLLQ